MRVASGGGFFRRVFEAGGAAAFFAVVVCGLVGGVAFAVVVVAAVGVVCFAGFFLDPVGGGVGGLGAPAGGYGGAEYGEGDEAADGGFHGGVGCAARLRLSRAGGDNRRLVCRRGLVPAGLCYEWVSARLMAASALVIWPRTRRYSMGKTLTKLGRLFSKSSRMRRARAEPV